MTARGKKKPPPAEATAACPPAPATPIEPPPAAQTETKIQPPAAALALSAGSPTASEGSVCTPASASLKLSTTPQLEQLEHSRRDMEWIADRIEEESSTARKYKLGEYLRSKIKDDGRLEKSAPKAKQIVRRVLELEARGYQRDAAVAEVIEPKHWPTGGRPDRSTVYRWLARYKDDPACRPGPAIVPR
jgi:hypothetical protein